MDDVMEHTTVEEASTRATSAAPSPSPIRLPRRLVLVFAVACGLVVANLYYAQPVLDTIAREFHSSVGTVGLIVTLTQIGYAAGLLFVVPLGDLLNRRRLVITVLTGTALALAAAALSSSIAALAAISLAIGVTSVVVQVLIPFAAALAPDAERGRVVGMVMSGLLLGVLLARTFSGLVAQVAGWRAIYWLAAMLMLVLIGVLWRELPRDPQHSVTLSYGQLLRSVGRLVVEEPVLRRRSIYGALCFAAFSVLWTTIAFLLAQPPYRYGEATIGLFGLAGAAGALCASFAGRLADRGWARITTGTFIFLALVSFGLLALGGHLLILLILGVVVLDLGIQGTQVTNQSEIYRLRPEARSRITTAYMVAYFVGGSIGSATAALVYDQSGWLGACLLGAAYIVIAFLLWLTEFRPRV